MQLYEFMVPTHYNNGQPIDHAEFDEWLGGTFGGYTKLAPATGFWRDENIGQVFEETVIPYRVATDQRGADQRIADNVALDFDQLAVYVGKIGTCEIKLY